MIRSFALYSCAGSATKEIPDEASAKAEAAAPAAAAAPVADAAAAK